MRRTAVRQLDPPRSRKTRDRLVLASLAFVIAFALVGLVSAGAFIADRVGAGSSQKAHHVVPNGSSVAVADVARAQAQATAIVKAGQDASTAIVRSATTKAKRQAALIVSAAKTKARHVASSYPTVPGTPVGPVPTGAGAASGITGGTQQALGNAAAGIRTALPAAGAPDLRGAPATWLVVGYNATFGAGPGSAGSISVLNRSAKTFNGVALVRYAHGGAASAAFSGLAPGQSEVLALNGQPYRGGGFHIILQNFH